MIKRFMVFGGDNYYPNGGWSDLIASFDSIEEAQKTASGHVSERGSSRWSHIVDLESGEIVKEFSAEDLDLSSIPDNPDRLQGREESLAIRLGEDGTRIVSRLS